MQSGKTRAIVIGAVLVVLLCAALPLLPFDDDLYYITPVLAFDPNGLLPTADHWRPLDYLFRIVLGFAPELYPLLNHVVVVAGHAANVALLYFIVHSQLRISHRATFIACLLFALSPAVVVAVFSIDALNQTWSMFFGLCAVALVLQKQDAARIIAAFACCWVAVFWKESGMVFFAVAPIAAWGYAFLGETDAAGLPARGRVAHGKFAIIFAIGLALCAVYLALRFSLAGFTQLGADKRYVMSLAPAHLARNFAVMVGGNIAAIDSIALFLQPRNWMLLALTFALSCPFLIWLVRSSWHAFKHPTRRTALLVLAVLSIAAISPYLVMGSAGEMHAYQLTPFFATGVALLVEWEKPTASKFMAAALVALLVSALICDVHKWACMKAVGESTLPVYEQIVSTYGEDEHPEHVAAFAVENGDEPLYSVFAQTVSGAAEAGQLCGARWSWRYPETFELVEIYEDLSLGQLEERYPQAFEDSDSVWVVTHDGRVTVYKRGENY